MLRLTLVLACPSTCHTCYNGNAFGMGVSPISNRNSVLDGVSMNGLSSSTRMVKTLT
jgi:hypothetical protein